MTKTLRLYRWSGDRKIAAIKAMKFLPRMWSEDRATLRLLDAKNIVDRLEAATLVLVLDVPATHYEVTRTMLMALGFSDEAPAGNEVRFSTFEPAPKVEDYLSPTYEEDYPEPEWAPIDVEVDEGPIPF